MYFILKGPCTKTHTKHYVTQLVENVGVEVIFFNAGKNFSYVQKPKLSA